MPATIAIVDGSVRIGLDDAALEAIASARRRRQVQRARPAPVVPRAAAHGATTVAATSHAGRARRHRRVRDRRPRRRAPRGARDLGRVGRPRHARAGRRSRVVCAGVKSILDVGATLERLETLNVTRARLPAPTRFPGFYLADSGFPVPWRVDSPRGGRRRRARARASSARRRRSSSPTRCRGRAARPRAARARARGRARGRGAARACAART